MNGLIRAALSGIVMMIGPSLSTGAQAQELLFLTPEDVSLLPSSTPADGLTRRPLARGDHVAVVRAVLPPGADIAPHAHPTGKVALVTVLSGHIEFGLGDTFDASSLHHVPVGGLVVFRADDPQHFARAGADGAEILVVAVPPETVVKEVLSKK